MVNLKGCSSIIPAPAPFDPTLAFPLNHTSSNKGYAYGIRISDDPTYTFKMFSYQAHARFTNLTINDDDIGFFIDLPTLITVGGTSYKLMIDGIGIYQADVDADDYIFDVAPYGVNGNTHTYLGFIWDGASDKTVGAKFTAAGAAVSCNVYNYVGIVIRTITAAIGELDFMIPYLRFYYTTI